MAMGCDVVVLRSFVTLQLACPSALQVETLKVVALTVLRTCSSYSVAAMPTFDLVLPSSDLAHVNLAVLHPTQLYASPENPGAAVPCTTRTAPLLLCCCSVGSAPNE